MLEQAAAFREESEVLYELLATLSEDDFSRPTLFKYWTANDILGHLHWGNMQADNSLNDEARFLERFTAMKELRESGAGMSMPAATKVMMDGLAGKALLEAWREFYGPMSDRFAAADPKKRVKWVGPDMSVRSSITARLMETWSHGQAAFDLFRVERQETDRIKNVAVLGVNTFGWTFINRGEEVPASKPYIRLTAPSGAIWEWNDPSDDERIEGSGLEFCQVVTQTRSIGDTSLSVTGPVATKWMAVAQCFAGPVNPPPTPGTRHMAAG
ncbi:MAG: TIGR03084 family metal-binding protein [Pseudomonadota bacterium]|nr:TIGR03084 family metal-binding protein [Pseudomonadota bacterium]